jgi:GNAT superfamily N-acetyltransferase
MDEISRTLFAFFQRTQNVTKCWRKIENEWLVKDICFVDDWSEQEYQELVQYLKKLKQINGFVAGAFIDGQLKGFVSVEPTLFGDNCKYVDLSSIHVLQDMRGKGIGKTLFCMAKKWARDNNADKLYISAHSSIESQAFYHALGCIEAMEYNKELAEKEPCDCQLECGL